MLNRILIRLGFRESRERGTKTFKTRSSDSWAEAVRVELKSLVTQAILTELESREEKFLSSILGRSQFSVDSLVVTPLDLDTSGRFEAFLDAHREIDPNFRNDFFRSLLEPQYRSDRGALVIVAPHFQPSVQFLSDSLEQPSEDELYQITLRGRRIRFRVKVVLSGPVPRPAEEPKPPPMIDRVPPALARRGSSSDGRHGFVLKIRDAQGERQLEVSSPCLLGREAPASLELEEISFVPLHGRYVSRRHLVLVAVLDETYFFLHEAASLSCISPDGTVLERAAVYAAPRDKSLTFVMGVPEAAGQVASDHIAVDQFPRVEVSRRGVDTPLDTHVTPRPRAIR